MWNNYPINMGLVMEMLFYRYYIKAVEEAGNWTVGITPDPDLESVWLDGKTSTRVAIGDRAYPMGAAIRMIRNMQDKIGGAMELSDVERLGRRAARQESDYAVPRWRWIIPKNGEMRRLSGEERPALTGKLLSATELAAFFRATGNDTPVETEEKLHAEVLSGWAERLPGVDRDEWGRVFCRRCGETRNLALVDCAYCGGRCWVCQECASLGPVRDCMPLYRFVSDAPEAQTAEFSLQSPTLTPVQAEAANEVRTFCRGGGGGDFLVWAVCGAGKTEVSFPAIHDAVNRGERVLYAVPRRDVVREIGGRMQKAFPDLPIAVLFGGEGRKDEPLARLTVATTHQVLRFAGHFNLVILDEADAYPYEGSRMLRYGLHRALRPKGCCLYLTATPTRDLRERTRRGELGFVTIPARHHGYPLPVPELNTERMTALTDGNCRMPDQLLAFLKGAREHGAPVLIFLPTVQQVEGFGNFLKKRRSDLDGLTADWVHAGSSRREQAVEAFRKGEINVLVSTTVLERGLNFPGVHIAIVHADEERVFDLESLVQMAGRAGRFADKPFGRVLFLGQRITGPMREAREWIEIMNREGFQRGLLKKDGEPPHE